MSQTVSDFVLQRLHPWGVRHILGFLGDGINGVFGAMNRADRSKIDFVQARHEDMAAFMATVLARLDGPAFHLAAGQELLVRPDERATRKRVDQGSGAARAGIDSARKAMR